MRYPIRNGLAVAMALALLGACQSPSPSSSPSAIPSPSAPGSAAGSASAAVPSAIGSPAAVPTRLALQPFATGLDQPLGITNAGDGSRRLFVTEQGGLVRVIGPDGALRSAPFLDLRDRVLAGGERGLLGLAFHPGFPADPRIYVDYTRRPDGATVVSELSATSDRADPTSERILLLIPQPFANHNGGQLVFGPDGYLYIATGDGGSGGDPHGNGQNTSVLLGKILRIDVNATPSAGAAYAIPASNPFAPGGADPGGGAGEVWAYGLRNPWRFSFDTATGDLYIGDVGQSSWEEIDRQPAGAPAPRNYGWNAMEGRHCYQGSCDPTRYVAPVAEYGHDLGCAVIGGYVYRGVAQPALDGTYVFGDDCSGTLFAIPAGVDSATPRSVLQSGKRISAFGTGEDGELYLADLAGGGIYRVVVPG